MGVTARLVTLPFPELLPALERGEVDLVMSGLTITPKRNLRAAFVGPYFVSGKSLLTKQATLESVRDPASLSRPSFRVAALRDSTSEQFVQRALPDATLVTVDELDAGIAQVVTDDVDALVADYETCAFAALRRPEQGLVYLRRPFTVEPIGIALPPDDPLLVNLIGNYLAALESTGLLEKARAYWFENPAWMGAIR
jgi:ABC-type amino acid transport substrate-binding protein